MADFQSNQMFTVQPSYPSYIQLSQYPTPCEEYCKLWCFILGDCEPFLPLNIVIDIYDLKEVIYIRGIDTVKSTALPKDLVLWKAREPELLEPHETFVDCVSLKFLNLAEVATKLGPSQKLSTLFPQQSPQDCLHIIVQMSPPDTGSEKHVLDADDNDHPPPKRSRTGDVVPGMDLSLNRLDYSGGHLTSSCTPFFPEHLGHFLVDKMKLIEDIVESRMGGIIDLVLCPRCCGKSSMLQMMNSFFSFPRDSIDKVDLHHLFSGLYITDKHEICRDHMGKYTVIFCDFQMITGTSWDEMLDSFKEMVSDLYGEWREYLWDSLDLEDQKVFQYIHAQTASDGQWRISLRLLSKFLTKKSGWRVIVLIDEYEAPNNRAYEFDFFKKANKYFGVLPALRLLKSNKNIAYALLAGVMPVAKAGWYSGVNNIQKHPLHEPKSIFTGELMFTEAEVLNLRKLSGSELDPKG